jgi:NADPH2:quinone reductase
VRAVVVDSGEVRVEQRPDPVPREGELLVAVEAAGLNGADLLQRAGRYPPPPGAPADIPGMELAGTVVGAGPGVSRHREGDRVMGLVAGGAQAELCLLPQEMAMDVPAGCSWPEAGGFPEVFTTAHDALVTQCGLASGERLLVTGAAGGVGLAAVQIGHLVGAEVVASVRNPGLREAVAGFGANEAIAPESEEDHGPYDVVIELVGVGALPSHLRALRTLGRIVVIGVTGSGPTTQLDALQLMARRAVVRGSTLRNRPLAEKAATARALGSDVLGWLADGAVRVPLEATYPLEQAAAAYDRFAAGGKLGKIVLVAGA